MKNEPTSNLEDWFVLGAACFVVVTALLFGHWTIDNIQKYGIEMVGDAGLWKMIILLIVAILRTGLIWVAINAIGAIVVSVAPIEWLVKCRPITKRLALRWLDKYIDWQLEVRQSARDHSG